MSQKSNSKKSQQQASPKRVESPKKIDLKPDHLKLLQDVGVQEQEARNKMAFNMLNIDHLKKQREAINAKIEEIEDTKIAPAIKDVYTLRTRMQEMGISFMDFYELPQREGMRWTLAVDDGAWILMPHEE